MGIGTKMERKWEDLGTDCLVNIFSKLDLEDLTISIPFVCKPWHDASVDPHCWKFLNIDELDLLPWSRFSVRFKEVYNIKQFSFPRFVTTLVDRGNTCTIKLAFPAAHFGSLEDLVHASIKCPRLKMLSLPDLYRQEDKHIPELTARWKDLEFLNMGRKLSSFAEVTEQISLNCKNFSGLQLSGCVRNEDAVAIVKDLPKLKSLVMRRCSVSKSGLVTILDGCRDLELVEIMNCAGFVVDAEILKRTSFLKVFKYEEAKPEICLDYYDDVYWGMFFGPF